MANNVSQITKQRALKYLNRDFDGLKQELLNHIKIYFPSTYQDFNQSSLGVLLVELMAFVGDNFNYYLDKRFQESFIDSTTEKKNLIKHANQLGFKTSIFGKAASAGTVDAYIKVPATASNQAIIPDMRYAGIVRTGTKLKSKNGKTFETIVDVDFSTVDITNTDFATAADRDPQTQIPTSFALRVQNVPVKAGETKTTTFNATSYQAFQTFTIQDQDVLEVVSVTDSQANKWYEVDYLAQDTIFDNVPNNGSDSLDVPYIMKLRTVPYRFITQFDVETSQLSLIFGTGDASNFDGDLIPNLGDLSLPVYGQNTFSEFSIDPQNYLKTSTLGVAPVNTTLTVKYRVGGGLDTNVGARQITQVVNTIFDIGDTTLDTSVVRNVANSFSVVNTLPIQGGREQIDIDTIKQLISANFAAQNRLVTIDDFIARALSMPPSFGSIFRANARPSPTNPNAIELIVLALDSNDNVSLASASLKQNLKTYLDRFRMVTDAIEILDGEVINLALDFAVLTQPGYNKAQVLTDCISALTQYFEINNFQINQPINLTELHILLAQIPGVITLYNLNITNRVGNFDNRSYSHTTFNVEQNTKNGIIYCPENSIFEFKFPTKDFVGTAK